MLPSPIHCLDFTNKIKSYLVQKVFEKKTTDKVCSRTMSFF